MARLAIVLAGALCLLSLAQLANSQQPQFTVKGRVFCEVCRANFINKFSKPMAGAEVKLECKDEESGIVTYSSSQSDCAEIPVDGLGEIPAAEITLTANNGFHDEFRYANALFFTKKEAQPECEELYKELEEDKKTRSPCLDAIIYMMEF
ncbi:Pollen allergen Che a 1 [Sesamum angolense]|uniref:Pollen allergen Che a 1 n=1 Tax=Sesamum angolense TaxID=2727404 RepID=A0AAE1WTE7_9LAMI|nr:Pollen allergen Che a 1 [Sesamum angolense]